MKLNELNAISPIDGRYREKTDELSSFFSEFALIKYRVTVEVKYFIALYELNLPLLQGMNEGDKTDCTKSSITLTKKDARRIKDIEKTTNHDVKAVEYFLKEKFDTLGLSAYKEFIHFGLTSQDINNTAFPMMWRDALQQVYILQLEALVQLLEKYAEEWKDISMLAHTHGQPASPTRLGKEIEVFAYRLRNQIEPLKHIPAKGKFGGATGNFNAHHVAYPAIDWAAFANKFLAEKTGFES